MDKLYWSAGTAAFAPQAMLEEAGVPYEIVDLEYKTKQGHRTPDYLALNPGGYIPALVTGEGEAITESAAIMLWLGERHAEVGLVPLPGDPDRGRFLRWLFYMTNTVQDCYKRYYYPDRYSAAPDDAPRIKAQARRDQVARWQPVEALLADPGPYVLGQRYSAADIYLAMLATWFEPKEELLALYPGIGRCFALAAARPAIRRTLEAHGEL